jgi:hypothetical protein
MESCQTFRKDRSFGIIQIKGNKIRLFRNLEYHSLQGNQRSDTCISEDNTTMKRKLSNP